MTVQMISVARDFTRTPGPRYIWQGKWSGEQFRKRLQEAFRRHDKVIVDLDGTRGYGSSFLDEAFGGLIREGILPEAQIFRRLEIRSTQDPTYKVEAEQAIRRARPVKAA